MPSFDIALLQAGEKSGRLPNVLKLLAHYYEERAQLARTALSALAYPLFLFHFAVFIGPFPTFFQTGNLWLYVGQTLGILLPIYALAAMVIYACQGQHGEAWRSGLEQVANFIPLVGKARRALALARLSAALEALINAGVPIIEAWELAASASGSPALRRAVLAWRPEVVSGTTPAEALRKRGAFPDLFTNLYYSGEVSGQLDDTLKRLHAHYQDEGARKLKAFSEWLPKLVYLGIMLFIAYRVITFYQGYFQQINDVLHF
jgi:type II secretory pathway component PulF